MSVDVRALVDLPDNCLVEIIQKCSAADVLRLQVACNRLLALGRLPNIWVNRILKDAGFCVPRKHHNYHHLTKIYRGLVHPSETNRLEFSGAITDGGCQDGMESYWVNNLFKHNIRDMYCSEIVSRDVRCMAIHSRDLPFTPDEQSPPSLGCTPAEMPASGNPATPQSKPRELSFDETLLRSIGASQPGGANPTMVVTRKVIVGRMGVVTCPVLCGVVLAGDVDLSDSENPGGGLARKWYKGMQSREVEYLSGVHDLESLLFSCKEGKLVKPRAVVWDRAGEWVEFDSSGDHGSGLRPVVWFRFYKKQEFVLRNSRRARERRVYLSKEFGEMGVVCGRNDAKPMNKIRINASWYNLFRHHLLQIDPTAENILDVNDESDDGGQSDGDGDEGVTDPLQNLTQWMDFHNDFFLQSYAGRRNMAGRDYMEISLKQPMVGNMVGVCLSTSENLMSEYDEEVRPEPNIDANIVWMVGNTISID
ncbi:hypothetical protein BSKO_10952 [Bryopsis sp. KO-2023]|nr:hypothetical protein BSKO_10952 [Bryopsis sp. KO-2023]